MEETSNGSADYRLWEEAEGSSKWMDMEVRSNDQPVQGVVQVALVGEGGQGPGALCV